MSTFERSRETRRYDFYRNGFHVMLPVFALLVVFACALSVALSLTVLIDRPHTAYAVENGSITAIQAYSSPYDPRLQEQGQGSPSAEGRIVAPSAPNQTIQTTK